jgi:hypothetical protein
MNTLNTCANCGLDLPEMRSRYCSNRCLVLWKREQARSKYGHRTNTSVLTADMSCGSDAAANSALCVAVSFLHRVPRRPYAETPVPATTVTDGLSQVRHREKVFPIGVARSRVRAGCVHHSERGI